MKKEDKEQKNEEVPDIEITDQEEEEEEELFDLDFKSPEEAQKEKSQELLANVDTNSEMGAMLSEAALIAQSGIFGNTISPESIVAKALVGRSLNLDMASSQRLIHAGSDGKITLSTHLERALIKKAGVEFVLDKELEPVKDKKGKIVDRVTQVTFFYKSKVTGKVMEQSIRYYWSDAVKAGLADKGTWKKHPKEMCISRAISKGAKLICPDALGGLYTYNELNPDEEEPTIEIE